MPTSTSSCGRSRRAWRSCATGGFFGVEHRTDRTDRTDHRTDRTDPSNRPDRTVILETPPPPQVVERGQQFVPYQVQSARLDALERAMAEYVRKYPSAAGIFETIDTYADQFQSGKPKQA